MYVRLKLIQDILELEEELWIPIHRSKRDEIGKKDMRELTMYYNSLVFVRENPV